MSAVLMPLPRLGWVRQAVSGSVGTVVLLALLVSLGVLAFAPLGADAARLGVAAAFANAAVSAVVYALLARSAVPCGGPSSATSAILAGLVLQVLQSAPAGLARDAQLLWVLASAATAVVLMGLLQLLMAALRVGRLVAFVPQTAMSGFMNGVAVLVLLAQLPALLGVGVALWREQPLQALAAAHPAALLLGLGTAGLIWLIARRWPRLPGHVLGMLAGTGAYLALSRLWPDPAFGPTLGTVVAELPTLRLLTPASDDLVAGLLHNSRAILVAGATLALMGTLETMLALRLLDQQTRSASDENRALLAAGLANLLGGLAGALPLAGLRSTGTAIANHGGRGRVPALLAAGATVLLMMALDRWIASLPRAVVAGVMVTIAVALADHWSRDMLRRWARDRRSREMRQSLVLVLAVATITVVWGTAAGVGAGVALSAAALMRGLHGSVVRGRQSAQGSTSRRLWPPAQERALVGLRQRILVLELEGALFFGSTPRVAREAQDLPPDCRFVIIDMRRVSTIDESGATMLRQLSERLASRGVALLLAAVTAEKPHGQRLLAFGTHDEGGQWHPDTDRAIEAAETRLLAEAGIAADVDAARLPLASSVLLRGLSAGEVDEVVSRMTPVTLQAGERLFSEGEPADGLYLVTRGTISVVSADGEQRFVTFPPGVILGETALLDGGGRTASAVADEAAEVLRLTLASLDAITRAQPALAAQLYRNIARHGSERLRRASRAWRLAAA